MEIWVLTLKTAASYTPHLTKSALLYVGNKRFCVANLEQVLEVFTLPVSPLIIVLFSYAHSVDAAVLHSYINNSGCHSN